MKWSAEDRQRFADRDVLRAATIPAKIRSGPDASEWPSERRRTVSVVISLDVDSDRLYGALGTSEGISDWLTDAGLQQARCLQEMLGELSVDANVIDIHPMLGRERRTDGSGTNASN